MRDFDMSDRVFIRKDVRNMLFSKNVYKRLIGRFEWSKIVSSVEPFETVLRNLYVAGREIVQNRSKPFHAIYKYLFVKLPNRFKPFYAICKKDL